MSGRNPSLMYKFRLAYSSELHGWLSNLAFHAFCYFTKHKTVLFLFWFWNLWLNTSANGFWQQVSLWNDEMFLVCPLLRHFNTSLLGHFAVLPTKMRSVITDRVVWSDGLSVCDSSEPCKNGWTDPDAVWDLDSGGPKKALLGGVHTGATWWIPLNRSCAVAIQPVVRLLWPLVLVTKMSYFFTDRNMDRIKLAHCICI